MLSFRYGSALMRTSFLFHDGLPHTAVRVRLPLAAPALYFYYRTKGVRHTAPMFESELFRARHFMPLCFHAARPRSRRAK